MLLRLFFRRGFVVNSHVLLDYLLLSSSRLCVYLSVELSMAEELVVALHEHPACFVIEGAFLERNDQEALDDLENVS